MKNKVQLFEKNNVRSVWDEEQEKWWWSIIDVIAILTDSVDPTAYWRKPKQRLIAEGNETVTNCHGLKMLAPDLTDVADTEQLLRLIQSIPSKKKEIEQRGGKVISSQNTKQLEQRRSSKQITTNSKTKKGKK